MRAAAHAAHRIVWVALRRTLLAVARLLGWLAADPARLRAALGGLVLCVALGCALGWSIGLATEHATAFVLGKITVHRQR